MPPPPRRSRARVEPPPPPRRRCAAADQPPPRRRPAAVSPRRLDEEEREEEEVVPPRSRGVLCRGLSTSSALAQPQSDRGSASVDVASTPACQRRRRWSRSPSRRTGSQDVKDAGVDRRYSAETRRPAATCPVAQIVPPAKRRRLLNTQIFSTVTLLGGQCHAYMEWLRGLTWGKLT